MQQQASNRAMAHPSPSAQWPAAKVEMWAVENLVPYVRNSNWLDVVNAA